MGMTVTRSPAGGNAIPQVVHCELNVLTATASTYHHPFHIHEVTHAHAPSTRQRDVPGPGDLHGRPRVLRLHVRELHDHRPRGDRGAGELPVRKLRLAVGPVRA